MKTRTRALTEGAVMTALGTVLSLIVVFKSAQGGSITAASMVPVILIALRWPLGWALLTSLAYAGLQMLLGFYPPPTPNFVNFALVVGLDYVVAFGVLGLAGVIARRFKNIRTGALVGTVSVCALRFVCHFFSGMLIWSVYAGDQPAALYSLLYNGSYMLPETIITAVFIAVIAGRFGTLQKTSL